VNRRDYLRAAGTLGAAATASCLGLLDGDSGDPDVVLGEPNLDVTLEQHRARRHPVWGERVPDVRVAAIDGSRVAVRDLDRPAFLTYHFTHCRNTCLLLVSGLVGVQADAVERGNAADVAFLPITFDPARDDAERLRAYGERMNVRDTPGWRWLRPESEARARAVVEEGFGVSFEARDRDREDEDGYLFLHSGVIHLVNADGYVERAYRVGQRRPPPVDRMLDHLDRLRG
jgi:protein SCO1/2